MSTPLRIGIIIGSTRPGRVGPQVAAWVAEHGSRLSSAQFEIVDIAEFNLPVLDEPMPASMGQYSYEHTKALSARISPLDGFIFVVPEYNHAPSPATINTLAYLYNEWNNKPAGLVGYGYSAAGARTVDKLRSTFGELQIADVRQELLFSIPNDFENYSNFAPGEQHIATLQTMIGQIELWGRAMRGVREELARAAAAA